MISVSFWGSPGISANLLERLIGSSEIDVKYVITQQDKPRANRSRELMPTPVKETAIKHGIPVFTPKSLKKNADAIFEEIKKFNVDLNIVFAYGKIIPERFFNLPDKGTINFHASLLPKLRGASPIENALMQDFKVTGWTMQKMVEELDAGDVYYKEEINVLWEDDFFSLAGRLMERLISFSTDVIKDYADGKLSPFPQIQSDSTHCGKIETSAGKINWDEPLLKIRNYSRALSARGGVFTYFNNKKIKLFVSLKTPLEDIKKKLKPGKSGEIIDIDDFIWVQCQDNLPLPVYEVQPEGKKRMGVREFVNGYRVSKGSQFNNG